MPDLIATDRVHPGPRTDVMAGNIRVDWIKAIWLSGHMVLGAVGLFFFFEISALLIFLALTAITICAGHSVGMHRLLIHRSFRTPIFVEYVLVWLGVLVGMAGPFGMIRAHDIRDWHQRQTICPPHPAHAAGFWRDAIWQLCCRYDLRHPPEFRIEGSVQNDPFYRIVERFWMAQQLPLAALLWVCGGWAWVLCGVSLRIAVSLIGHWMVGHFAHRHGAQDWVVRDVAVQGYNLPWLSWVTFGENWHGNHHAFPHSARLGVEDGQGDPGFWLVKLLAKCGLATDIQLPHSRPDRAGLMRLNSPDQS